MPVGSEIEHERAHAGRGQRAEQPARVALARGSTWRVGGSAVKIAVPVDDRDRRDDQRARGRASTAAIAAVSSGPLMKISSIIVESSA